MCSHTPPSWPDCGGRRCYAISLVLLLDLWVQVLLQLDAELLAQGLELLEVLLVLLLVLDLGLDACWCCLKALVNRTIRLYLVDIG